MRVLCLDVGNKRIGLAVSGPSGTLATPLTFIKRTGLDKDVRRVLDKAKELQIERITVGLPLTLKGEEGEQAKAVRSFVDSLRAATTLPVETWDERLSTWEAERLLRESGHKPSRERGHADAAAAAVILQDYLNAQKSKASTQA